MEILDISYEENSYVVDKPTLEYNKNNDKWEVENYPSYIAVKNKSNMCVPSPINDVTPFDFSNPHTQDLFGIHVFNKKFCFDDVKIIPPVYLYPYLGDDVDKKGEYFNYNGILTGYVLNGVSEDDVKVDLDGEEINFITLNEDNITNPETKRLLCTNNSEGINNMYGKYMNNIVLFYKVPYSKNTGSDYITDYEFEKCENCIFYTRIDDKYYQVYDNSITPDNNDVINLYYKSVQKDVDDNIIGSVYIQLNDETYDFVNKKLRIFFKENDEYKEINVSDYHYIELQSNSERLNLTDGYGDGDEILINGDESNSSIFSEMLLEETSINENETISVLKLRKEDVESYDSVKIYKCIDEYTVYCDEEYIEDITTTQTVESENVNTFLLNTENNNFGFKTVITKSKYKSGSIKYEVYNYKISYNVFNSLVLSKDISLYKDNNPLYSKTNITVNEKQTEINKILLRIVGVDVSTINNPVISGGSIGNLKPIKLDDYEITCITGDNGDIEVFVVKKVNNSSDLTVLENSFFNVDNKTISVIKKGVNIEKILDIQNEKDVYITLKSGAYVKVGDIFNEDEIEELNENNNTEIVSEGEDNIPKKIVLYNTEQTIIINKQEIKYSVYFKNIGNNTKRYELTYYTTQDNLQYPQVNENAIFKILEETETPWKNEICKESKHRYLLGDYYHFNVRHTGGNSDSVNEDYTEVHGDYDKIFIITQKKYDNINYYNYSPKLSLEKCDVYEDVNNLNIYNSNDYISNYPFIVEKFKKQNGVENLLKEINVNSINDNIDIYTPNVEGDIIYKITDYTGLTNVCVIKDMSYIISIMATYKVNNGNCYYKPLLLNYELKENEFIKLVKNDETELEYVENESVRYDDIKVIKICENYNGNIINKHSCNVQCSVIDEVKWSENRWLKVDLKGVSDYDYLNNNSFYVKLRLRDSKFVYIGDDLKTLVKDVNDIKIDCYHKSIWDTFINEGYKVSVVITTNKEGNFYYSLDEHFI